MLKQILSTILKQKESLSLQDLPKVLEDKNTKLLDVREVDEFASGHIPEAINQPH